MQIALTILTVTGAIVYLVWRFVATAKRKKQSGCEKCSLQQ